MSESVKLENAAFGAVVVFLRTLWGWTQEELAGRCGGKTTKGMVSNWENGKQMPNAHSLRGLARALGVELGVLYDLQERTLGYVRDNAAAFDSLLRASRAALPTSEVREPQRPWGEGGKERLHAQWQELARDRAAIEERQALLLRDTVLESLGGPADGPSPDA